MAAAREKGADSQRDEEVLEQAAQEGFWTSAIEQKVVDEREKALLEDFVCYLNKDDFADFMSERGVGVVAIFIKLLSQKDSDGLTDFALAATDRLLATLPASAGMFRSIALEVWDAHAEERKAAHLDSEYIKAQALAQAEAAAKQISGEHKILEDAVSTTGPQRAPRTELETLGPLCDNGVFANFLDIMNNKPNGYQVRKSLRILSILLSEGVAPEHPVLRHMFRWLEARVLTALGHTQLLCLCAIKDLLKNKNTHYAFEQEQVMFEIVKLFNKDTQNMQLLYLVGFCIWLLSFNTDMDTLLHSFQVVKLIVSVVRTVIREKVVRICFAVLANVLGRPLFTEEMIGVDLHRTILSLKARQWKDKDIVADMAKVEEALSNRINELSSFDMYTTELLANELRRSPVHNEKFWRENAIKFEDNKYELIRLLVNQLGSDKDESVEVACYDLGEFVRFHPDGKRVLSQLEGKAKLMRLMSHKNPAVAKAALLAVQKLMVNKWDQMLAAPTAGKDGPASPRA